MATNYLKHFVYCNQVKYDYNVFNGETLRNLSYGVKKVFKLCLEI